MKKLITIIVFYIFILLNCFAQEKFIFDADYAVFRNDDTTSLIEIYLAFYHNNLIFKKSGNQYQAGVLIDLEILNKSNDSALIKSYKLPISLNDSAQFKLKQKELTQLPAIPLKSGDYKMTIIAKDAADTTRIDKFDFDVPVPLFTFENIKISGIQLSTSIKKTTGKAGMFDKFGYEVTPNPNQFFGNNFDSLFFYFELYGLKNYGKSVFLKKYITNINDSIISSLVDNVPSAHNINIETGNFNIRALESGTYFLKVDIIDNNNNVLTSSEKKFYVYNTVKNIADNTAKENADFLKSEYATMTEQQLDNEFEKAVYIRTDEETKNYKSLNSLEAKRKFMYIFWTKRDNTPYTQINEYKINYFKRIENANKLFKEPFQEGWKTDRGRIYMLYGEPNDIERFDYEADIRSYQIWHYETIEGGTICVFAESNYSGSGIYELVHSTIRGELRNDDWKNQLKKK